MTKQPAKKMETWHVILIAGVLIVAVILAIFQSLKESDEGIGTAAILNADTCHLTGGEWSMCLQPCTEEGQCLGVCMSGCVCVTDFDCPFGYSCAELVEGVTTCQID